MIEYADALWSHLHTRFDHSRARGRWTARAPQRLYPGAVDAYHIKSELRHLAWRRPLGAGGKRSPELLRRGAWAPSTFPFTSRRNPRADTARKSACATSYLPCTTALLTGQDQENFLR